MRTAQLIIFLCLLLASTTEAKNASIIVSTDKQALVNLGRADNVSEGEMLGVFRDGKRIGSLVIDSVKEDYSVCRILKRKAQDGFLKGDIVSKEERQGYAGARHSRRLDFDRQDAALKTLKTMTERNTQNRTLEVDLDGNGKKEKVSFNSAKRLQVRDEKGNLLWESAVSFGKDENVDIVTSDLNKDGKQEIFAARNIITYGKLSKFLPFEIESLKRYKACYIYGLEWNGKELVPKWRTERLEGYISGLAIDEGKEKKELSASVVWSAKGSPKSSILFYTLE